MSKKITIAIAIIVILIIAAVAVFALRPKKVKNVEGTLEEIFTKLYSGIADDEKPMVMNTEITEENIEYFLGTKDIDYKEAMASEAAITSIAHSVVIVRLNDASKANETVTKIKENANPRKWICVEASDVIVKSKGDLVILIMSNENLAPKLDANFEGLE